VDEEDPGRNGGSGIGGGCLDFTPLGKTAFAIGKRRRDVRVAAFGSFTDPIMSRF
jgi:hypothetical protein